MAFSSNRSSRAPMADINVTPLVDVMLVLLIIFMVTAPMLQEGVSVELPAAKGEPIEKAQQPEEIVISVSGVGSIFVNEKAVTEDQLASTVPRGDEGQNEQGCIFTRRQDCSLWSCGQNYG